MGLKSQSFTSLEKIKEITVKIRDTVEQKGCVKLIYGSKFIVLQCETLDVDYLGIQSFVV